MNYKHELVIAVGQPISENPTGIMMEAAFRAKDLKWRYQLIAASISGDINLLMRLQINCQM